MSTRSRALSLAGAAILLATAVACQGGGAPPVIDSVEPQVAQVGEQLSLTLVASDPDGDPLDFRFASQIPTLADRATLTRSPAGAAIWRWTPLAADVGTWYVDFTVSDGSHDVTETVEIDVQSAVGGAGAPVFRSPLGTGTTLDLATASCLDLPVVVDDQDSTQVAITQVEPLIEGATLTATGDLSATWHWCPSPAQISGADDRFTLTLSADDGDHPPTLKTYLIVLRAPSRPDCPGAAPAIAHTPADVATVDAIPITAQVSDDLGLKEAPLVYTALADPGATPDLSTMTQATMTLTSGTMQSGTWTAHVPNPVASQPAGATAGLWYVIVADDDDDPTGSCDHETRSPTYHLTVTHAGNGTTAACGACTTDAQCAGAGSLCVRVGASNDSYCLAGCSGAADCASGTTCSATPVGSVDGATGRACVPDSGSCTATTACIDDAYEDNDTRAEAAAQPALPANHSYPLVSCPLATGGGDDEDWFKLVVTADAQVHLAISGTAATDLDLALTDDTGAVLQQSTGLTADEHIDRCLTAGTYYARVYSWGVAENDYLLAYDATAQSCAGVCNDDAYEPDDDAASARITTYPSYTSSGTICSSDDWFEVTLYNSEHLTVDLTFTQTTAQQDLDLHLINKNGTDLTPCHESNPATCSAADGQSADSNEHYEYTAPQSGCSSGCPYDVVVHGWNGSTNSYDIAIGVQ